MRLKRAADFYRAPVPKFLAFAYDKLRCLLASADYGLFSFFIALVRPVSTLALAALTRSEIGTAALALWKFR